MISTADAPVATEAKTHYVYFVQAVGGGLVKIGHAANVAARVDRLQTGSPVPLRVLAVIPWAGARDETEIHAHFAAARAHGEWFRPVPELLAYIEKLDEGLDPLLSGDEDALNRVWKLSPAARIKARHAVRSDLLSWLTQRRTASALERDKRTAAELLACMPDDLTTVEQAVEVRNKNKPADGSEQLELGAA